MKMKWFFVWQELKALKYMINNIYNICDFGCDLWLVHIRDFPGISTGDKLPLVRQLCPNRVLPGAEIAKIFPSGEHATTQHFEKKNPGLAFDTLLDKLVESQISHYE